MRKAIPVLATIGLLLAVFPANAALQPRRYTLPPGEDVCVECWGLKTSAFVSGSWSRKVIVDCRRTIPALRWGGHCSMHWSDRSINLRPGQRLIVSAGRGDPSNLLITSILDPNTLIIENW